MQQPILNGILESPLDLNGFGFVNISGLLGTFVTSTESTTNDGQVVLFNGTGGKVIRKSTATGIAKLSSGVLSAVAAPTGDLVGHDDSQILYNKTLSLGTLVSNLGLNFERPSGAGIISLLPQGGASSLNVFLPSVAGTLITAGEVSADYVPTNRTVNGHALSSNVTVTPADLGLVIGTNVQAWDATLDALAAQVTSANTVIYATGQDAFATTSFTALGRAVVGQTTAANARITLGAGTVNSVSVTTANGISGSVATATTTPAITLSLGAITPISVVAPNDTDMLVRGGSHTAGPTFLGASLTLGAADPSTHLANITLTPVAGGSVIISSLTSNGFLKTSGGTGTISVDTTVLGTAATKDTGTTNGTVPLLGAGGRLASGMIPLGVQLLDPDSLLSADLDARTLVGDDGGTVRLAWAGETLAITADLAVSGTVALANLASNGFVKTSGGTGALSVDTASYLLASYLDTDGTLAANSDAKVASQKAVKTYVTAHTVTNSAGANVVPKSNGTNLIASSIVDDGTVVKGGYGATKFSFDAGTAGLSAIGDIDGMANGTKIVIDDANSEIDLTGQVFLNGTINPSDGTNITFGTSVGSKLGTTTSDKLGFWSAAPVVQNTGWGSITNVTSDKVYNANSTTLDEVADVLGTLIAQLVTYGILGA